MIKDYWQKLKNKSVEDQVIFLKDSLALQQLNPIQYFSFYLFFFFMAIGAGLLFSRGLMYVILGFTVSHCLIFAIIYLKKLKSFKQKYEVLK